MHRTLAEDDFLPPVTDNSQPVTSEHFTPGLLNALFFVKHAQLTDDGFAYLDYIVNCQVRKTNSMNSNRK